MAALQTVPIDALITDVNLPGLSGPELARKARALHPAVAIVFCDRRYRGGRGGDGGGAAGQTL